MLTSLLVASPAITLTALVSWMFCRFPIFRLTKTQRVALGEVLIIFVMVWLDLWVFDRFIVPWLAAIGVIAAVIITDFVVRIRNIKKGIPPDLDPAGKKSFIARRIRRYTHELGLGKWKKICRRGRCFYHHQLDFTWAPRLFGLVAIALVVILIAGYFFKPEFWKAKDFWTKKIYIGTVLYLLWGSLQQIALQGYVTNKVYSIFSRSTDLETVDRRAVYLTALSSAILFFLVHIPNPTLMIVTPIAGAVTAYIFLNCRNIPILGIAHGILGNTIGVCLAHGLRVGAHYWSQT